jgi:hypothetical protein
MGTVLPAAPSSGSANSAFRVVPASAPIDLQDLSRRSAAALGAIPAPLGAIPAPLGAIPAPLGAIPAPGQIAPPSIPALCALLATLHLAGCQTQIRTDVALQPAGTPANKLSGLLPGDIQAYYGLPALNATSGAGRTIALIVAFDDPAAEADLAVYRTTFGLPPCTTANGCFTKIAENGSKNYPPFDPGWSVEAATDIETVSAVCPGCNIMLVEAASANIPDLATAVDLAAARGATAISNSYGVAEASDNVAYDSHYNHPGVAVVVAAGDRGYGVTFPASSEYVIAVGGTSLYQSVLGGVTEDAWPLTNSGCSAYIPKPAWQKDFGCSKRTMNDVGMVADPATGMAIYDSVLNGSSGGWTVIGGTSIGAPIVSSIITMGAHPEHFSTAQQLYTHSNDFFGVTWGSNGTCLMLYLCTALPGYNGPAGIGTPNGIQGFNT